MFWVVWSSLWIVLGSCCLLRVQPFIQQCVLALLKALFNPLAI